VPSVLVLGTWTTLRSAPGGLCHWRSPEPIPKVALTFDDGPSEDSTPRILDRLDQLGLRATFFCLGHLVDASPELVREIERRGHAVGTHGYHHERHLLHSPRWIAEDLAAADEAMAKAGTLVRWFRPPYGIVTGTTLMAAARLGLGIVLWSAWGKEWADPDPGAVAERVCRKLDPGAIVLLHDADSTSPPGTWKATFEALGPIAETANRRGLQPVTMNELLEPGCRGRRQNPECSQDPAWNEDRASDQDPDH